MRWFAILLAGGFCVLVYNMASPSFLNKGLTWWVMIGVAAVIWAIGWIINFVLTGRTTLYPE